MDQTIHVREESRKVLSSLLKHVYMQGHLAIATSLFCAVIVFAGLFHFHHSNIPLYLWSLIYLIIAAFRMMIFSSYKINHQMFKLKTWYYLYILGSFLGGLSWGIVGMFLFSDATTVQQTLIILMIAGVTAGAVPLSAAIPSAAILFLLAAIVPMIYTIAQVDNRAYFLFDIAVPIYLGYNIILVTRTHQLIKNSILLKFENDTLLNNLEISNKKLSRAATHDPLTHVANRRLFEKTLIKSIRDARIQQAKLTLFYIDLDNFKFINDHYGHHAGDHVLLVVIGRLKNFFRKNDVIARIGGDELAVIIGSANETNEIKSIAGRICQLIGMPIEFNQVKLTVTSSIGIAIYPNDGEDENVLLNAADRRMYIAKEQGGNSFYYEETTPPPMSPKQAPLENRDHNE
ncbi:MAG: diguanylate cyclase [Gammaproteobacteria bacterium]|nr:diguanylate cyclase [Gammaproteobacteria bacterium]